MNKILGSRGIGKSSQLIQYASENNIEYIICINPKHHITLAYELGIKGINFINVNDIDELKRLIHQQIPFLIDDISYFLCATLGDCLKGYTESV